MANRDCKRLSTTEALANTNSIINGTPAANPTTQDPPIELGNINLKFGDIYPDKKDGTRPAETLTEASSGTTHSESEKAKKGFLEKLSAAASEVKNNLTTYLSGNKISDKVSSKVSEVANPLLNSEENINSEIFVGGSTKEPTTLGNRFLDLAEAGKSEEFSSATSVEGNNNPTKEEGQSSLFSILSKGVG
jgi:hypothetical protein